MTTRARRRLFGSLVLIICTLCLSYFFPVVTQVNVINNRYLSNEAIMRIANVDIGAPFLWISAWSLDALTNDPWIAQASVTKQWPNIVTISVEERRPFMTDGEKVFAQDGTWLPNANSESPNLLYVTGWGTKRSAELVKLVNMLKQQQLEPKMVSYTPAGFTIQFANSRLFTPSLAALQTHWSSVQSLSGARISVYPWGVSAVNE